MCGRLTASVSLPLYFKYNLVLSVQRHGNHGLRVCRKKFVFYTEPQQWYESQSMHSYLGTVRTHQGCGR
jgi:hypothetical protein